MMNMNSVLGIKIEKINTSKRMQDTNCVMCIHVTNISM